MKFDNRYFIKFTFTPDQIEKNLKNAIKDLNIAKKVNILEVKFNYAYNALIKAGITLLSHYHVKIKSVPGHHVRIIEKLAQILSVLKEIWTFMLEELKLQKKNVENMSIL